MESRGILFPETKCACDCGPPPPPACVPVTLATINPFAAPPASFPSFTLFTATPDDPPATPPFTYQWMRAPEAGGGTPGVFVDIPGATDPTYTDPDGARHYLLCRITGCDGGNVDTPFVLVEDVA